MDTTSKTNSLSLGEITQHEGYTMQDAGTVKLGRTTFKVRIQQLDATDEFEGSTVTWLQGPRGGDYTLEPVSHFNNTGIFRLLSFNSGSFLRVQGNELRVLMVGDLIEVC